MGFSAVVPRTLSLCTAFNNTVSSFQRTAFSVKEAYLCFLKNWRLFMVAFTINFEVCLRSKQKISFELTGQYFYHLNIKFDVV